ncbi:MAG TPA: prolyl oligopeptidase family serine peptidase [Anaerolineales bacterium]|nr:prolyl oligopeptidase family serine peptidase [Anaerolineales bacterium]
MNTKTHLFFMRPISTCVVVLAIFLLTSCESATSSPTPEQTWPSEVTAIEYISPADNTPQPALFYKPATHQPAPLLVALHTWSGDYQSLSLPYAEWCIKNNWVLIHPNFRGPNDHPEATGSDMAIQDILSAVDYAKKNANVDPNRIYLVGASGGGYTALMVVARDPDIWAAASVWVPITDLSAWYYQSKKIQPEYADDIVKSLGGAPGDSAEVDLAYQERSPITHLSPSITTPIDINAGIHDGHLGRVFIDHSLLAFNALADPKDQILDNDINYLVNNAQVPKHLIDPFLSDPSYGVNQPLFRKQSGRVRITIFDGGHEIIFNAALTWLSMQSK